MPLSALDGHWTAQAACGSGDVSPDALFVEGAAQRQARNVCTRCPVRLMCLADALDSRMDFGVWGGMTERERRALLRRRPEVRSWWDELVGEKETVDA
ncbi:WhiB family transcriptional regulator [Cellulomonas massiliensis]|uniref:WhiB family transcriptional regulator n=1 Tax=Cellulomonas massiliensis TaxID=1465811 RepID=UPI000474C9FB|nr:WhiB family transcriptional regulator [Cellulomonas massiliensis]